MKVPAQIAGLFFIATRKMPIVLARIRRIFFDKLSILILELTETEHIVSYVRKEMYG